jgi:hypothetical protein
MTDIRLEASPCCRCVSCPHAHSPAHPLSFNHSRYPLLSFQSTLTIEILIASSPFAAFPPPPYRLFHPSTLALCPPRSHLSSLDLPHVSLTPHRRCSGSLFIFHPHPFRPCPIPSSLLPPYRLLFSSLYPFTTPAPRPSSASHLLTSLAHDMLRSTFVLTCLAGTQFTFHFTILSPSVYVLHFPPSPSHISAYVLLDHTTALMGRDVKPWRRWLRAEIRDVSGCGTCIAFIFGPLPWKS